MTGKITRSIVLAVLLAVLLWTATAQSAEIQFRAAASPSSSIVRLGDVAEVADVDAGEAERLRGLELFPAPVPGEARFVPASEVEQLLDRRGFSIRDHRFSGATQIRIRREAAESSATRDPGSQASRPPSKAVSRRAQQFVERAVAEFLSREVSADERWQIESPLTPEQARAVDDAKTVRVVRGRWETRPGDVDTWLGAQQFLIGLDEDDPRRDFVVRARVSLPPLVVVAARPVSRGEVIRSGDVRLQRAEGAGQVPFSNLTDVVGMEVVRNLAAGEIVERESVQLPVLVQRGEVVTVYVRSAGVKIRTLARSQKDGSRGELIEVQGLTDRRRYFAVVSGPAEVEVYARSASARRPQRRRGR